MNRFSLALATALSLAALAATAETPHASGQFASGATRQQTRAEVQADFVANRDRVAAFTREDSGSAYLATNRATVAAPVFAGQPVNAR